MAEDLLPLLGWNISGGALVPVPANGDGNSNTEGGGTQPQEDGGRGGDGGEGEGEGQRGDGEGQGGEAYGDNGGGGEDEGGGGDGGEGEEGQGDGEEQGGEDYRDNGEGGGGGDEDHYDENDSDEDDENNDEEEDDTTDSDDEHMEEGEDEMEADIGGATAAPPQPQDINYDASLPGAHAYLGTDLEDVRGRTVHEDDSYLSLPILSLPGVVLVPGQTLPLHLFQPSTVAMIRHVVDEDKTFGLITSRYLGNDFGPTLASIGTTAEIFSIKLEDDNHVGISTMRVKATGRQRFEIKDSRRQADGIVIARVRILPERVLPDVLEGARPRSHARICCCSYGEPRSPPRTPGGKKKNREHFRWPPTKNLKKVLFSCIKPQSNLMEDVPGPEAPSTSFTQMDSESQSPIATDSSSPLGGLQSTFCARKLDRFSAAYMTWWPPWVYRLYDEQSLMYRVKEELQSWNETLRVDNVPQDPTEFSFWVAGNLPLDDGMKLHLLKIDSAVQRLRCELSIMQRCTVLCCKECGLMITNKKDVFSMALEGPMNAYVNPGGYVHETLTVYKAQGLNLIGRPSTENSWFPGYAWTIVQCRHCSGHMGWRFTAVKRKLCPDKFWGLTRQALMPGLHSEEGSDEAWMPSM